MSKRGDTWMPIYIGDYLADTGRLTTEGHGAYLLLIFDYWRSGEPLPDDDEQLASIARLPLPRWRRLRPVLERFFQSDGPHWRHKRIDEELRNAGRIVAARSSAGKAGAAARWGAKQTDSEDDGNGMANASDRHRQTDGPSPSPSPKEDSADALSAKERREGDFDEWWSHAPRKLGKGQAERAYRSARKRADAITLLAGIDRYSAAVAGKDPQFTKHPATWLNGACWLDEPDAPNGGLSNGGNSEAGSEHSAGVLGRVRELRRANSAEGVG